MIDWTEIRLLARCVWEAPQNAIGAAFAIRISASGRLVQRRRAPCGGRLLLTSAMASGVSLGLFVFAGHRRGRRLVAHEIGHTYQSMLLGPMYLPLVGLPSFLWFWSRERMGWHADRDYYTFWTERWADRLGGVRRRS